jgi:two-component system chemotaxis response regulator CheB
MERSAEAIVVIGASAGGIEALREVVAELPPEYQAGILIVVHIGTSPSVLPRLLARVGPLPASHASHGEWIRPGHIYVAPPDHHLLVRGDRMELSRGPRENHSRPAIDPLFRSAARAYGRRVAGVILSGALNDGTAGLLSIKAHGGMAIVQDPADAIVGGMPESALRSVAADHVLAARDIGAFLVTLTGAPGEAHEVDAMAHDPDDDLSEIIQQDFAAQGRDRRLGQVTMYTCPDCGGTLWQAGSGPVLQFRCHVGHAWGPEVLLDLKSEELEAALWASVRLLEERATLSRQVAVRVRESTADVSRAVRIGEQAMLDEQRADLIRELLHAPLDVASQVAVENGHTAS